MEGPDGTRGRKDTSVSGDGELFLRALALAREKSASCHLKSGMLRAVQTSPACCDREKRLPCLVLAGLLAQGPAHRVWW